MFYDFESEITETCLKATYDVTMMLLIFIVTAIFGAILIKFAIHKRKIMRYVRHLPCPKEYPLVGSAYRFIGKNTKDIMDIFVDLTEATPTPSRLWFGPTLVIIVGKAEDMQIVMNSPNCLEKTYVYKFLEKNVGLFSAPAHIWKPQRKLLNATFSNKIISSFIPIFNQKAEELAKNLDEMVDTWDMFDISTSLFACTLDMICATTLGVDLEYQKTENKQMLEFLEKMSEIIARRMVNVLLHPDCIYKWTSDYKKHVAMADVILEFSAKVRRIKQREFEQSKFNAELDHKDDAFFNTPQIFINELFKMHEQGLISDQTVDDQVVTMLIGGNETTALTVSNVVLMLAIHQDMQETVFREIKAAHHNQTSHTDYETTGKLNYLEMFIKETLRHLPVGPILGREALSDTAISNCVIPKGSIILLSLHHLHKDKDVWGPEAHKFDPENFSSERSASRHPYAYAPFSGGHRNCIGIKYAWISMKIMISLLIRRYKFTTDLKFEDLVTKWNISLKLVNKHMVRIQRRSYD